MTTDVAMWSDFETAIRRVRNGAVNSVEVVFTEDNSHVGADLYECRVPEAGTTREFVTEIIDRLNSFIESSSSETGYHLFSEGTFSDNRNPKGNIGWYETAQVSTVTGDRLEETSPTIESRTDELKALDRAYLHDDGPPDESPCIGSIYYHLSKDMSDGMANSHARLRLPLVPRLLRWGVVFIVATTILYYSVFIPPGAGSDGFQTGPFGILAYTTWLHGLAYAGLAVTLAYTLQDRSWRNRTILAIVFIAAIAYGAGIELLQGSLAGRTAAFDDLLVNAVGAATATVCWRVTARRVRFYRARRLTELEAPIE